MPLIWAVMLFNCTYTHSTFGSGYYIKTYIRSSKGRHKDWCALFKPGSEGKVYGSYTGEYFVNLKRDPV